MADRIHHFDGNVAMKLGIRGTRGRETKIKTEKKWREGGERRRKETREREERARGITAALSQRWGGWKEVEVHSCRAPTPTYPLCVRATFVHAPLCLLCHPFFSSPLHPSPRLTTREVYGESTRKREREREREGTKPDTKHRVARRRRGGGGGGRRKEGGTRGWREVSEQGGVGAPFVIYICVFYTLFTASIILHFICSRVGRSEGRTHGKERNKGRRKSFLVY